MNPNRRVCSCGTEADEGSIACANCGADLAAVEDGAKAVSAAKAASEAKLADLEDMDVTPAPSTGGASAGGAAASVAAASVAAAAASLELGGRAQVAVGDDLTTPMRVPTTRFDTGLDHPVGTIFGSYRLVKQIGSGGMGRVFIAEHTRLGRQVALKVLRTEYSGNVEAVKRFFAEAQAVNRINHENIIEVSDFIENASGASFYIMELLKGVDLRTLEDREGVLPLARTLGIAIQVCRGLAAAHDASIVHRDLKPDNIFLTERGGRTDFVKLLDFGIAKLMNATVDSASTFKSTAGIVVGTPDYMSPEQALGQQVDHRADIYAMGVILFEMVTGRRPFDAMSAREIMVKHMMVAPPRPGRFRNSTGSLPPALEELILACLKKEPRDRPQSIKDVEQALTAILEELPKANAATVMSRTLRDKRLWLAVGGTLVFLVALMAVSRRATRSLQGPGETALGINGMSSPSGPGPGALPLSQVQISFESTPPGATVSRVGDPKPLGVTPFAATFEKSPRSEVFEFHIDGWKVGSKHLVLLDNAHVEISLEPSVRRPGVASASGNAGGERTRPGPDGKRTAQMKGQHQGTAKEPVTGTAQAKEPPPKKAVKLDHDAVMNPFE